jgi:hypothetical protein
LNIKRGLQKCNPLFDAEGEPELVILLRLCSGTIRLQIRQLKMHKKSQIFFTKPIDKRKNMCYNEDTKGKGIKT